MSEKTTCGVPSVRPPRAGDKNLTEGYRDCITEVNGEGGNTAWVIRKPIAAATGNHKLGVAPRMTHGPREHRVRGTTPWRTPFNVLVDGSMPATPERNAERGARILEGSPEGRTEGRGRGDAANLPNTSPPRDAEGRGQEAGRRGRERIVDVLTFNPRLY